MSQYWYTLMEHRAIKRQGRQEVDRIIDKLPGNFFTLA